MRQAINENRTVQLVLVGLLALAGGFMLLRSQGSGGSEGSAAEPAPATTGDAAATAAPPAPAGAAPVPADTSATGVPAATGGGAQVPVNMIPGPGLPKSLLAAYRRGDAVALLVRRAGGIDDALVHSSVELLSGLADVEVFVTKAQHIARYSWLTQGVNVNDLPALVVLRPRKLTKGVPTAIAAYGFRNGESVLQAVEDALYRGPADRPYHP